MPKCQSYSNFSQKWRNFAESGHIARTTYVSDWVQSVVYSPNRKLSFPQNNNWQSVSLRQSVHVCKANRDPLHTITINCFRSKMSITKILLGDVTFVTAFEIHCKKWMAITKYSVRYLTIIYFKAKKFNS